MSPVFSSMGPVMGAGMYVPAGPSAQTRPFREKRRLCLSKLLPNHVVTPLQPSRTAIEEYLKTSVQNKQTCYRLRKLNLRLPKERMGEVIP